MDDQSAVFTASVALLCSRSVVFTVWIAWLLSKECGIHSLDCLAVFKGVWHSQFGLPGCVQGSVAFTVWIAWLCSRECGIHSLDCLAVFKGVWHSQFGLPGCVQGSVAFTVWIAWLHSRRRPVSEPAWCFRPASAYLPWMPGKQN